MHPILSLLRVFFRLLYHQLAWTYDLVAAVVSLGRWQGWVQCSLPYLNGRVLELGCGPGYLQVSMRASGLKTFGLDESEQMAKQASRKLGRSGFPSAITRGYAQELPFPNESLDSVVSTFPSEYIYETQTLAETWRVLVPGGRLIILLTAWIISKGLLDRLAAWLFKVTREAGAIETILPCVQRSIQAGGFATQYETIELPGSRVLVIIATKG
jgi:ubiquinone/menaquinone biosynthesis C-methylase UbiE